MKLNRLLPYLFLNILVSASTTLLVIYWWDLNRTESSLSLIYTPLVLSTPTPAEPTPTLPPLDKPVIQIKNVYGIADLQNEAVIISRLGDGELELTNWQITDENGNVYTFPKLILNKDGAVQIFTRSGADTVIDLFWNQKKAIWSSGGVVSLLDPNGAVRASYQIP
jgi:hypothetical protein